MYICDAKKSFTPGCNVLSPGGLSWSVGMVSVFYIDLQTELGFKMGYCTLLRLKCLATCLFIMHHAGSEQSGHNITLI